MTFARVPVEERERPPARTPHRRYRRAARLGVVVPALALALASCKKSDTATPGDQAPADTASTSQSETPQAPDETPVAGTPETAASPKVAPDMEAVSTSTGSGGATPSGAPPPASSTAAARPAGGKPAAEAPSAKAAEAAPSPASAPAAAPAALTPALESAPADTPSMGGQQAGGGTQGQQVSLNATPEVYEGWKHFSANCERCHGQDAVGSSFAPSLLKSIRDGSVLGTGPLTHDVYIGTVVAGRPAKGMPSWVQLLDHEKMENIWAYLNARASGQLAPGRPIKQGG